MAGVTQNKILLQRVQDVQYAETRVTEREYVQIVFVSETEEVSEADQNPDVIELFHGRFEVDAIRKAESNYRHNRFRGSGDER